MKVELKQNEYLEAEDRVDGELRELVSVLDQDLRAQRRPRQVQQILAELHWV